MTYQTKSNLALAAMGEPIRQDILERLAAKPQAVSELASQFPVSRPAISQHLKILKEAGLVTEKAEGTRRIYRIDPSGIGAMRDWLDALWSRALSDFKAYVENLDATEPPLDDKEK